MARAKIGRRFTVTLPKEIRDGLDVNDPVEIVRRDDGVIEIEPLTDGRLSQVEYWGIGTPEWEQREREIDRNYAEGRYRTHNSTEEFLAALEAEVDGEIEYVEGDAPVTPREE